MRKNLFISVSTLAVVTCLAISMTACVLGEDIDTLEKKASEDHLGKTVNIAAITGVTKPASAGTPVKKITENDQYTGTVEWSSDDDSTFKTDPTFKYQKKYTATITLEAKKGYTLHLVKAGFFTIANAVKVTNSKNSGVITAEFEKCGSKATGAAVSAPELNTKTHNSITIKAISAPSTGQTIEYAKNTSNSAPSTASAWQTDTTFSGLNPATQYYIFARAKENDNYNAGAASSLAVTTLQTVAGSRIEYYWVDEHGSLVTTSNGIASILTGSTLTITPKDAAGYNVAQWYVNGVNTGQKGSTYDFSITTIGKHTVDLFLDKGGMLYNTSITIEVTRYITVTFDTNGGTGTTPPSQTLSGSNSGITLPYGSELSKTGYTFGGWNTNADGTGTNYSAGSYYTPTGNIILYAKWNTTTITTVTVTFNINGGTGTTPASQTVSSDSGSGITLPSGSGFSRSGYTFGGWNTNASGTGTTYDAGYYYYPTGNITLYARWNTGSSPGPVIGNGSESNPYILTVGSWTNGSITSSASGSAVWYSFNVISGTTYHVWWNDTDNGNGTLDIKVTAYYGNGNYIFDSDSNHESFYAAQSGTVKLKVYPLSGGNTGTFGIAYSTSSVRPQ